MGTSIEDFEQCPFQSKEEYWKMIFVKYDRDKDGYISPSEFRDLINRSDYGKELPDHAVENIMKLADIDESRDLDFQEFVNIIQAKHLNFIFTRFLSGYVDEINGGICNSARIRECAYEQHYSFKNFPVFIVLISVFEIVFYIIDVIQIKDKYENRTSYVLSYNPSTRYQAWRFVTYIFVHEGMGHILFNILVQIGLGIPLEMAHKSYRVSAVYMAGAIAGSLGSSIFDPGVFLIGASGAVYALMAAHVATLIMNWADMEFAYIQMFIMVIVSMADIGGAMYQRYCCASGTSYSAHFFGALAGILISTFVLRNFKVRNWERKLAKFCFILYFILLGTGVALNIFWTSHFLVEVVEESEETTNGSEVTDYFTTARI